MNNFSMTCSCGDTMTMEAGTRDEAVKKLQDMMSTDMVRAHMSEKHPGEQALAADMVHKMISEKVEQI